MSEIKKNLFIKCALVFLLFFIIFLLRHLSINGFYGTDAYYHAKHSWLIEQSRNINLLEPWLEFHFYNYVPTNPWWGYHLILAIFIHFFGPILGAKILASSLAALVFTIFYFLLNKFKITYALVWTWLFFASSVAFLHRLFLARPLLLSMSLLPLAFWLMTKKKYFSLFLLSLIYALLYNLAPLAVIIATMYFLINYYISKKADLKLLISTIGGVLAGILIHPRSLNYLYVMFMHLWQVLFLRFKGIYLGVGSEIQMKGFLSFIRSSFITITFFVTAVALLLAFQKLREGKNKVVNISLCFISCFWLVVTLFVPRAGDYWMSFAWLFIVLVFSNFRQIKEYEQIVNFIKKRVNLNIALFFLLGTLVILVANNFTQILIHLKELNKNNPDKYFQQVNIWLKNNTEKNEIIFHNRWDIWPQMFFYNHYNHYIIGMDPTFLYEYDPELFWIWFNIGHQGLYCNKAEVCADLSPAEKINLIKWAIKEKFRAQYILIANDPELNLYNILSKKQDDFTRVFENEKLIIYKIIN